MHLSFEQFPALNAIKICRHVFAQRIPGIDVSHDKAEVLERLDAAHREIRNATGFGNWPLFTAEQIHRNKIAAIDSCSRGPRGPRISRMRWHYHQSTQCRARHLRRRLLRGLHRRSKTPAIGLVHSGRKGTELGVVTNAIRQMIERFGSNPANMIVQLSPCIRPPRYKVDLRLKSPGNVAR